MLRASSLGLGHLPSTVHLSRPCIAFRRRKIVRPVSCVTHARHPPQPITYRTNSTPHPDPALQKQPSEDASPSHVASCTRHPPSYHGMQEEVGQTTSATEYHTPPDLLSSSRPHISPTDHSQNTSNLTESCPLPQDAAKDQVHLPIDSLTREGLLPRRAKIDDREESERVSNENIHIPHEPKPTHVPPVSLPTEFLNILAERLKPYQTGTGSGDPFSADERAMASLDHVTLRMKLLYDLSRTASPAGAWQAYTTLTKLDSQGHRKPDISIAHLHRLFRLLAPVRPKTRSLFHQLLDVVSDIHRRGGRVQTVEWNVLVYCAGMGFRKSTIEDFERSLSIYRDMVKGLPPGSGILKNLSVFNYDENNKHRFGKPDIYTYTSLITIASRTLDKEALQHALSLLDNSGIVPNRITYLSLLKFYSSTKMLGGVRSVLLRLKQDGHNLGVDGLNACIWAYGQSGRLDVVKSIYRLLRHNSLSKQGHEDISSVAEDLEANEFITVSQDILPDEVTYTCLIQILAYHGDLKGTFMTFGDMLQRQKLEPDHFSPNIAIYRAIFLGFTRYGVPPSSKDDLRTESLNAPEWTLEVLSPIFDTFLGWDADFKIKPSVIYWIMLAFDKTSGRDITLLREVWLQLEERFDGPWAGRNDRLTRMRKALFPLEDYDIT